MYDPYGYTYAWCSLNYPYYQLAVNGVNCTQPGPGFGPAYGGTPPVVTPIVTGLNFNGVGLRGTLPATFGSGLSSLTSLYISNEQSLYGTLPASMSGLSKLQTLSLRDVMLNGTFDVLASLPALVSVDFYQLRAVSGAIPNFVSPVLQSLSVWASSYSYDSNCWPPSSISGSAMRCPSFSGAPLPNWNLPNLTTLTLSYVYYNNYVDQSVGWVWYSSFFPAGWNLPALTTLSLTNMPNLYGSLPAASAFPKLNSLTISNCGLNGSLPTLPSSLASISITGTPITGNLNAVAATQFTALTSLTINGASMTGSLPAALVPALNKLNTCALAGNGNLTCPLPANLTKLSCNPASCPIDKSNILLYCGVGDDADTCSALVDFAVALSFGTWQTSYANAWLQGGSYCSWPGVTCPSTTPGPGCCVYDPYGYTYAWCSLNYPYYQLAVNGVNCTQPGPGFGPAYGGTPPVVTPIVTGLNFNGVGLRGTLPATFGSGLSSLTSLYISNEQSLYGTLPASMSGLSKLQTLSLRDVMLNGTFDVLASLPALVSVDFYQLRAVSGAIPNFVSPVLQSLSVWASSYSYDSNCWPPSSISGSAMRCPSFSGAPLPNWNLPNLTTLTLSYVYYNNYVDQSVGWVWYSSFFPAGWNLPALTTLSLTNMPNLYGSLPAASAFPKLNSLTISNCGLNGSLPTLPSSLASISITGTPITGNLNAVAATQFTALTSLTINGASMTGSLPAALVPALNKLNTCALAGNGLTCPLPAGLNKSACDPANCLSFGHR